jgi:hypothetical protein
MHFQLLVFAHLLFKGLIWMVLRWTLTAGRWLFSRWVKMVYCCPDRRAEVSLFLLRMSIYRIAYIQKKNSISKTLPFLARAQTEEQLIYGNWTVLYTFFIAHAQIEDQLMQKLGSFSN